MGEGYTTTEIGRRLDVSPTTVRRHVSDILAKLGVSDRREAIHQAIMKAEASDVIIIAGKGHETYQIVGSDKFHFDDREIALEALEKLKEN